ncbi:MAG: hypothetical protein Q7T93_16790 [Methylobacterium sp.]|uniref:hypothetical protein n=1 Tax=Methylobacterium sp. TaxID=409 RepID=UPI0027179D4E|nr:hypothetical protein [Methylobacterium sp.]MDO9428476.1 hypothetical protein [Methylobacterium sp.]
MANAPQTTGELFKAKAVTDADIAAAVDAFMADPSTKGFALGGAYRIDLLETVNSNQFAALIMQDPHANETHKRVAIRTAILLARPEKV